MNRNQKWHIKHLCAAECIKILHRSHVNIINIFRYNAFPFPSTFFSHNIDSTYILNSIVYSILFKFSLGLLNCCMGDMLMILCSVCVSVCECVTASLKYYIFMENWSHAYMCRLQMVVSEGPKEWGEGAVIWMRELRILWKNDTDCDWCVFIWPI